ncbi:RadC family protein [Sporosarcina sp. JAI121]|uniref:JAB domain-containing protein n=1 Tax=Sporosarcina sp. JAI121 TaxID=2723064 RepID=UPI0017EDBE2B|nr:JAB domain-containing protein [Sporosarcina sp. JAI121]NYF23550.1 DNA repair protein RadC [Sporosarcina sp. JAI121]
MYKMCEGNGVQLELLCVKEEKGKYVPAKRVDIFSLRVVKDSSVLYKNRCIRSPKDGFDLFKEVFGELDREYFVVICLNNRSEPNHINVAHIGDISNCIVTAREVFKLAIVTNSKNVILFHTHPSGNPEPSQEDKDVTRRLVEAGRIIGIEVLDHLVIGDESFVSLKERGYV